MYELPDAMQQLCVITKLWEPEKYATYPSTVWFYPDRDLLSDKETDKVSKDIDSIWDSFGG